MNAIKSPIYQTAEIRTFEQLAIERFDISGLTMMQRAGKAAFDFLLRRFPNIQHIAICCGSGNNGGDGYMLARIAHERGYKVKVWQIGDHSHLQNEAKSAYEMCREVNLPMALLQPHIDFNHADLIVDAICGIGIHDQLSNEVAAAINKIEQQHVPILSIDVPTGIDADTGKVCGKAIHATATVTFIGLKLGLLTGAGVSYAGEVAFNDLQLPPELFSTAKPVAEKMHLTSYTKYLQQRPRDWHKGLSGHVLIVGGDAGYSGAPRMAAEAALRVGAGLVSVATRIENAYFMNVNRPEIMCHGVAHPDDLSPLLAKADVLVLGPGIGQSDWAETLFETVVSTDLPIVIDADALNILSRTKKFKQNWVLTPHPGEAGRLLNLSAAAIQDNRLAALREITNKYGGVTVLKGAGSLVGAPQSLPALCDKGNPGMATAGMGDVLSGIIGSLIAQHVPLFDAAKLGVYMHAKAGDLAAKEGERGTLAMDLMPYLRRIANNTQQQS